MIFVKKNTDGTGEGFAQLLLLMERQGLRFFDTGSAPGLIRKNDVVLLKVNCQWDERGGTNTDLVKAVVLALQAHPDGFAGEIVIADNGQDQFGAKGYGGSMEWKDNNAVDRSQSMQKVADAAAKNGKVSAFLWDRIATADVKEYSAADKRDGFVVAAEKASTGAQVTYPKFRTKFGTCISFKQGIWDDTTGQYDSDRLKVINMPVLKSHSRYQVTAAVKHYMGTTSDKLTHRDSHVSIANGFMGTQMASTRMPVLNLLDCIWISPARGPSSPYVSAVQKNIVAASTDPVAMDVWAAKNVLMPAAKEAGNENWQAMDPFGKEPGTFGYWLSLSYNELRKAGLQVTMDESTMRVFEE